jgi:hypothetical protein
MIDETAAAERLSADDSGNSNIGSGAPPGALGAGGTTFGNSDGTLAPGRSIPLSITVASGSVSVGYDSSTTVSLSTNGREPICCIDGRDECEVVIYDPDTFSCSNGPTAAPEFQLVDVSANQIIVRNLSGGDTGFCGLSAHTSTNYYYL